MKNYKMIISYDGSRYYGWERKAELDTIQGKIETVLSRMTETEVRIFGSGRTDAGVHAQAMVASAVLETSFEPDEIRDYMNRYLPDDIVIKEVREASDRFHARYNAIGKTYRYTLYVGDTKPVFDRKYVWRIEENLNIDRMEKAAELLMGNHDFAAFCKSPQKKKSTVRCVDKIKFECKGDYLAIEYHGNGFLRHMVRILTGTLVEVALGNLSLEQVQQALDTGDRNLAGPTAPAQGLCLVEVDYH